MAWQRADVHTRGFLAASVARRTRRTAYVHCRESAQGGRALLSATREISPAPSPGCPRYGGNSRLSGDVTKMFR
jgi:hypothetical protein